MINFKWNLFVENMNSGGTRPFEIKKALNVHRLLSKEYHPDSTSRA